MIEEKAMKEEKLATRLKKQLQEKLNNIAEKNKPLLDLQRKVNEEEDKLLELQREISKILELETKMKGKVTFQDEMLAVRDKALMTYQRDLEYWKDAANGAVEVLTP